MRSKFGDIGLLLAASVSLFIPFVSIAATLYFLFIPGYLFNKLIIKKKNVSNTTIVLLSIGLSVLIMMILGLLLNLLGFVGVDSPLNKLNILISLSSFNLLLIYLSRNRKKLLKLPSLNTAYSIKGYIFVLIISLLPLLAAAGALLLNYGGINTLTILVYILSALLILYSVANSNKTNVLPYLIFCISLSLLLTTSLRGWGITGHDIQREFYAFNLTNINGFWDMNAFRDPYNACLSITILPTMLQQMSGIAPEYIFKTLYQMLFSILPVTIYVLARKHIGNAGALLAAFVFMLFPTFMSDMPMLNRQEIAFMFLGLLLLLNLSEMTKKSKLILTLPLALGVILSHYSTAYITIAMLLIAYVIVKLIKYLSAKKNKPTLNSNNVLVNPLIIIAIAVTAFGWNFMLTDTTGFLTNTFSKTIAAVTSGDISQSVDTKYALFSSSKKTPEDIFNERINETGVSGLTFIPTPTLPVTKFGEWLESIGVNNNKVHTVLRFLMNISLQGLVVLGILVVYIQSRKKTVSTKVVYLCVLSLSCLMLLVAFTILPELTISYGVLRLFQQCLIVASVVIVIGLASIFTFDSKRKYMYAGVVTSFMFLHLSGVLPQLTGGYTAQLSLNNSGLYYDSYYSHKAEDISARWIGENIDKKSNKIVQADDYAQLSLMENVINEKHEITSFLQPVNHAYRYYGYHNLHSNEFLANLNSSRIYYKSQSLPNERDDLIYSNNGSEIYRKYQ